MENNKKLGVIIGILVIIVLILSFYIVYDKTFFSLEKSKKPEGDVSEKKDSKEQDDSEFDVCSGTYYGEMSGALTSESSYSYKYTYILNSDGTYAADFNGVSGHTGTFKIENGKINFVHSPEIVGPDSTDVVETYDIASDCKSFSIPYEEGILVLTRK